MAYTKWDHRFCESPECVASPSPDSHVWIYMDVDGSLVCMCCGLASGGATQHFASTAACIEHVQAHEAAGHRVPRCVVPEMLADDAENFPNA